MYAQVALTLLGAALAQEVEADAIPAFEPGCMPLDLDTKVELAINELTDAEFDSAQRISEAAIAALPCVPRVADPDDLATLWQVQGSVHVFQGAPQLAEAPFRQSGAVYPGWFNDNLGPQARQAWVSATEGLTGEAHITAWPIPDDGVLYVDGAARDGREASVLPGEHLVQVAIGADVQFARMLALEDGQVADIATGLPEPTQVKAFTLPLGLGIASFVAAGGAVTGAILLDGELEGLSQSGKPGTLRLARYSSVGLAYVGTPLLVVGSGYGIWRHVQLRRGR
ncbi:MAG: hypothetical protein H6741_12175 [Alphaproteobacteria bacterium]|nr:hypothetical protein [Alphaproteobacteria bacterium]